MGRKARVMRLIDADAELKALERMKVEGEVFTTAVNFGKIIMRTALTIDAVEVVRCKDCKHNPKESWFGCPMSHLSEEQRPETAWCWKGERRGG